MTQYGRVEGHVTPLFSLINDNLSETLREQIGTVTNEKVIESHVAYRLAPKPPISVTLGNLEGQFSGLKPF